MIPLLGRGPRGAAGRPQRALSAFLAQTPANEGGQPLTAMPQPPQGDPLAGSAIAPPARPSAAPAPMPAIAGGGSDPLQTAAVATAQLQARRPRRSSPMQGLTAFLR